MARHDPRTRLGLPPAPRNAEAWIALPEISAGRYLLAEVGWVSSGREKAVAAGVVELPAPAGVLDNGQVALPAVTVVCHDGKMRMFRLPVCYAALVRPLVEPDDFVWRDQPRPARSVTELPCPFIVGSREDVYLWAEHNDSGSGGRN